LVPERQFAFALATNSMNGTLLARDVARDLIMRFIGNEQPDPSEIEMDDSRLLEYRGRYSAVLDDLEIDLNEGKLMMRPRPKGGFPTNQTPAGPAPPPFRIGFVGRDRVAMIDHRMREIQGDFLRNPDGGIAWLRWAGRLHAREL
jgi:hypothetical protein